MTPIKLCADDFGMNVAVNEAILSLVEKGRLNAVGCMATMDALAPDSDKLIKAIAKAPHKVDIGLHLTFTEYTSLTNVKSIETMGKLPEIGKLLIKTHLRQVDRAELKNEISAQFKKFETLFGRKPDFVDGHQHVHILPVIRDALFAVAKEHLFENGWMRFCYQPTKSILKTGISLPRTLLISNLSRPLRGLLKENNIKSNDLFLGINDFNKNDDYRKQMQIWLELAKQHSGETLIMCHPGLEPIKDSNIIDPIQNRRPDEFAYLASDEFIEDLAAADLTLS